MHGALPSRFRRTRVLIVGCGDIGMRLARQLSRGSKGPALMALSSTDSKHPTLRALGIRPLKGDLDQPASLRRLSGLAHRIVHLAPPPTEQWGPKSQTKDPRTLALVQALRLRSLPHNLVYASTSGVYGDCSGQRVQEHHRVQPASARAQRRVDAENAVRFFGRSACQVHILRIPGIYAPDREGGTPRARLLKGTPVLQRQDDVYTNHIHANDLARACLRAMFLGKPQRCTNVCDDSELRMGDYFDLAADLYGLPRPPRVPRSTAHRELPLVLLSFMSESRRLSNERMKQELRLRLHYPHVRIGLAEDVQPRLPLL
jgi:nucleoside-diphosphate-sugar epimerase